MRLFNDAKRLAKLLEINYNIDYSKCKVDVLADGYCDAFDANDDYKKSLFISGLILRFWYTIKKMEDKSPGIKTEEFVDWLYEAIEYACKYRAWRNPGKKTNAQQAINQCIETIRLQHYYEFNLDKHKANYNTVSIDQTIGEQGDSQNLKTLSETINDENAELETRGQDGASVARELIQKYIDNKKLVDAIILDTIAFNEVNKVTSTVVNAEDENGEPYRYTKKTYEFWPFRCVQLLSSLPENYSQYFNNYYDVVPAELEAAINRIKTANNQTLYKLLRATLQSAKMQVKA